MAFRPWTGFAVTPSSDPYEKGEIRQQPRRKSGTCPTRTERQPQTSLRQVSPGNQDQGDSHPADVIKCPRPLRVAHLIEREVGIRYPEGYVWLAIKERPQFRRGKPDPEDVMESEDSTEDLQREADTLVEQANGLIDALGVDVSDVKVSDIGSPVFRRVALAYERLWRAEALLMCSENRCRWAQTGRLGRTGQEIMERLRPLREKLDPYRRQSPIAHTNTE